MVGINFDRATLSKDAVKFIATFLRFEFALKEDGFGPKEGKAFVEWGRVTKELGQPFYTSIDQSGKAETIMRRPPKKQVSREHALEWKPQDPPANVQELFEAVRRVRNNLVHGGKAGDPEYDPDDPGRNEKLIGEAQWIIEEALHQMEDVKIHFEGQY